ncbi:MAG: carbon-nitrogen hydrolase family protein [Vulcanimicrobiaceae bacterium]
MSRTLTVAAVQLPAHDPDDFAEVWPGFAEQIAHVAQDGSRLVVLPEGTIPGYVLGTEHVDDRLIERALSDLRRLAAAYHCVIVCGVVRHAGARLYNAAAVIDLDGSIAGFADKTFLWHFDRRWFAPSQQVAPIATRIGRIGALVCADGRIPTLARALVDAGAEVLAMPTAWVTSGRNPSRLENIQADLLAGVRAQENGVPFIAANKAGVERGMVAYCGKSQIIGADGTVLQIASQDQAQTIRATIDVDGPPPYRIEPLEVPRRTATMRPVRIALSPFPTTHDAERALEWLDVEALLAPPLEPAVGRLDGLVPTTLVEDASILDPAGLVPSRIAGYQLFIWQPRGISAPWQERVARARAVELRCFLVVVDRAAERAYAIDPDANLICGTYGSYRIATCTLDLARTALTQVAPGSDILAGLAQVATSLGKEMSKRGDA